MLLEFGYTLLDSLKKKKKNLLLLYERRFSRTFWWKFNAINDNPEKKEKKMMPLKMV